MSTATELKRRKKQAAELEKAKRKSKTGRAARRMDQHNGVAILHDPHTTFRLKYEVSVPGGPLRGEYPSTHSGVLTAETEADLMRGAFVKLMESYGFTRQDLGQAVTGVLAEVVNPLSMPLRSQLLMQIAQGTGLLITVQDVTSCSDCGAEKEVTDILDPNAPEGKQLEQQDTTVHAEDCPGLYMPEWKTGPAVMIGHPYKYQPIMPQQQPVPSVVEVGESSVDEEGNVLDSTDDD